MKSFISNIRNKINVLKNSSPWGRLGGAVLLLLFASCSPDEDTTPSYADTDRLGALLDTSNDYIREFFEKYGTYILYDFDDMQDFAYQFEEEQAWRSAKVTHLEAADVPDAITFLDKNVFSLYSDSVKKYCFPLKLLITDNIQYAGRLGTSMTQPGGTHYATASQNSVAFGCLSAQQLTTMSSDRCTDAIRDMHFALIGGYIVGVLEQYPVDESFFDYGTTYYRNLIVQGSIQAKYLTDGYFSAKGKARPDDGNEIVSDSRIAVAYITDDYFYERGFFPPETSSDTYYGARQDDLVQFLRNVINLDAETFIAIAPYDVMRTKVNLLRNGLIKMGIDIDRINPLVKNLTLNADDIIYPELPEPETEPSITAPRSESYSKLYAMRLRDTNTYGDGYSHSYAFKMIPDWDIRRGDANASRQGFTTINFGNSYLRQVSMFENEYLSSESYSWVLRYNDDGTVQYLYVVEGYDDGESGSMKYYTLHTYRFEYADGKLTKLYLDGQPAAYKEQSYGEDITNDAWTLNPYYVSGLPRVLNDDQCGIPLALIYCRYLEQIPTSSAWTTTASGIYNIKSAYISASGLDGTTINPQLVYQFRK